MSLPGARDDDRPVTVFLSHAWADQSALRMRANPRRGLVVVLRDRLAAAGLRVFYDEQELAAFDDIEHRIQAALTASTVFVCWYSDVYRTRRACHWELMNAITTDARRVLVLNPEDDVTHILPGTLRRQLVEAVPDAEDDAAWESLAARVAELAGSLRGFFGPMASNTTVHWFGDPPAQYARFVGRSEPLWQLDTLLRPPSALTGGGAPPPAVVVHGMGGVGKTALVKEYATRFAGAYPTGVFWLRIGAVPDGLDPMAHLRARVAEAVTQFARDLDPPTTGAPADDDEPAARVLSRYLQDGAVYLWVVDDLPEGLSAAAFAFCLPPTQSGRALVTTRGTTYAHVPNLPLQVLPPDEALELLLQDGPPATQAQLPTAQVLAARLGHLPLALDVVGSLTRLPGVSVESLLEELTTEDAPLDLVEEAAANEYTPVSATEHSAGVIKTFDPSIRRLDGASAWLLGCASALAAAPVPMVVLRELAQEEAVPPSALRAGLGTLLSRSLIHATDDDAVEVHSLVAAAALRYLEDRAEFVARTRQAAGERAFLMLGDVEDLRTHPGNRRVADFAAALAQRDNGDRLSVPGLKQLGRFLHWEARYGEAADVERRAAERAAVELGPLSKPALNLQVNLAISTARQSQPEAVRLLAWAAEALESEFGAYDMDTLTAKHNLASQLVRSDVTRSRELSLEVYEARLATLGPDHPHTLFSLNTLLAGQVVPPPYTGIVEAYRDLVDRRTRLLGADDGPTLTSTSNFVQELVRLDQPEAAMPLARGVLAARERLYGVKHVQTNTSRVRLLCVLLALSDPPDGEVPSLLADIEQHANTIADDALQELANAGEALRRAGQPDRAVHLLETVRTLLAARPSSQLGLLVEHNLAAAQAAAGDLPAAMDRYDGLLPRVQAACGDRHRLTLRVRRQRALVQSRLVGPVEALADQRQLAEAWAAVCGPTSPEYAEALGDLADTYSLLGQTRDAERCLASQRDTRAVDRIDAAGRI